MLAQDDLNLHILAHFFSVFEGKFSLDADHLLPPELQITEAQLSYWLLFIKCITMNLFTYRVPLETEVAGPNLSSVINLTEKKK